MQNRTRLTNLLLAGTLTALVLAVFLTFGGAGTETAVADAPETSAPVAVVEETTPIISEADRAALQEQIQALQAQNQELRNALALMQERETQYQAQIETANQTITELQAQAKTVAGGFFGDRFSDARPEGHHDRP